MINLESTFSPRINAADGDYPYGSIKDNTTPGANDGTPLAATWGNDIEGFRQAVVQEAAITPSGLPDTAIGSQVLDGLKTILVPRSELNVVVKTFDSVASMDADASLSVGKIVDTVGYISGWAATLEKPKGGNRYEIVSAATGTHDGGSIIDLTASGLKAKGLFPNGHVYADQFGAVGDGVTVNTTQINNALAFSSVVRFGDSGHYKFDTTIPLTNKQLIGGRRSISAVNGDNGVLLDFVNTSTAVPAINVGGQCGISGVAVVRTGAGTRGVIINVVTNVERTSYFRDIMLAGASYCIYSPSFWVYSSHFENIELGNYNNTGIYLNCTGATGNVYTNIYSSDWLTYPTVKNSATAFIYLTGSHTEATFNQINCEHVNITNSCIILNGVETFSITSLHVEGVEFNGGTSILKVIGTSLGSVGSLNGCDAVFNKMLGNEVKSISIETTSTTGKTQLKLDNFHSRDNDLNGTTNHRFAFRAGSITTNTPTIIANGISSDIWGGNNYLPIESTTYKPVLEKFNDITFYQRIGDIHYMPGVASASWPPASGAYPKNAIVMNTTTASTGDRGWHTYGRGDFANPQYGTIGIVQFSSAATPDATAYAAFAIGDYILVNSVVFLITNKFGGNTFTLSPTPSFTTGTYDCFIADPQYRAIL